MVALAAGIAPHLRRLGIATLDLLLPPHCPVCDTQVMVQGTFCPACFSALTFITEPLCQGCGLPFASVAHAGRDRTCRTCATHPPAWRQARAALLYDDAASGLILRLKHADRQENASILAAHMARVGKSLLHAADVLVPVPLHRWRLFRRGFNQAALLAQALSRRGGPPALLDALRRTRRTSSLGALSATERARELDGAIAVRATRRAVLASRRILLIDDVMTSGATASACTQALLDAGAANVDVLVASRVPDPRQNTQ
jgi:ComF family protein